VKIKFKDVKRFCRFKYSGKVWTRTRGRFARPAGEVEDCKGEWPIDPETEVETMDNAQESMKLSKSAAARIKKEHEAGVRRMNAWADEHGVKCTCNARAYGDTASHSSVCAIFKKWADSHYILKQESASSAARAIVNQLLDS